MALSYSGSLPARAACGDIISLRPRLSSEFCRLIVRKAVLKGNQMGFGFEVDRELGKKQGMKKHTPVPQIERFVVKGLHGFQNRNVSFVKNQLILVGENGAGKTTISRMLAYFLTRQWALLSDYAFDTAKLVYQVNGKRIESEFDKRRWDEAENALNSESIVDLGSDNKRIYNRLMRYRSFDACELEKLVRSLSDGFEARKSQDAQGKGILYEFEELDYQMNRYFAGHVLYLPTYRRIEEEWGSFFNESKHDSLHKRDRVNQLGLISFGMEDVRKLIDAKTDEIREYSRREQNSLSVNYLKKIIAKEYRNVDYKQFKQFDIETVMSVLNRVSDDILLPADKIALGNTVLKAISVDGPSNLSDSEKIVCHYFLLLRQFDESLKEKEKCFSDFIRICNSYLRDKSIKYNSYDYSCSVVDNSNHRCATDTEQRRVFGDAPERFVDLRDLSSGEKQIVGLFSKLCLEKSDGLFVFIDEPELSLSIDWQRRLLPDVVACTNCKGLFAATHSPFVFDNELIEIVHGINEF